jgi:hypothetical protein
MESLFSRLFKYRSSDKRVQQENFLTEIFAFLLEDKNVPGLLDSFLNEFEIIRQNQLESIRVETQRSFFVNSDKITPEHDIAHIGLIRICKIMAITSRRLVIPSGSE